MANWLSNWVQKRREANMLRAYNNIGHEYSTDPKAENYMSQNEIDWTLRYIQNHKDSFKNWAKDKKLSDINAQYEDLSGQFPLQMEKNLDLAKADVSSDLNRKISDFYGTSFLKNIYPIDENALSLQYAPLTFSEDEFSRYASQNNLSLDKLPEYQYLGYQGNGSGIWNLRAKDFATALMNSDKGLELYKKYAREDGILDDDELKLLLQEGLQTTGDGKVGINTLNAAKEYLNEGDYNTMSAAYNLAVEAARLRRAAAQQLQASSEERRSERPQNYEHNPYSNPESYDLSSSHTGGNNFDPMTFKYSVEGNWWEPSRDTSRDSNSYWDATGRGFDLNEDGSRNYVGTRSWFGLGGTNHLENSRKEFDKWYRLNNPIVYSGDRYANGNTYGDLMDKYNEGLNKAYEEWLYNTTKKHSTDLFKQGGILRRIKLH